MHRFLAIFFGTLSVLLGLVVLTVTVLWTTPLGIRLADGIARPIVKNVVEQQLGSDVEFAQLEGSFPGRIIIRDLQLTDEDGVWAKADRFVLEWNPLDLFGREIHVREIVLADAAFYRMPPMPEREPKEEEDGDDEPSDPPSLPDIRVDSFVVHDFVVGEALLGQPYTLSLISSGRYTDPKARLSLFAETNEGTDTIRVTAAFDGETVDLDASVESDQSGLISELIKAEAPTGVAIRASGPLEDLTADIAARAGVYGDLFGSVSGSVDEQDRLAATLTYEPGSFLPQEVLNALGPQVRLDGEFQYTGERASASIGSLSGAFGDIEGDLAVNLGDDLAGSAALTGTISPVALTSFGVEDADAVTGAFRLNAEAATSDEQTEFNLDLASGSLSLTVEDGRTGPELPFEGSINLSASGLSLGIPQVDPLIESGIRAGANIRLTGQQVLNVGDLTAILGTQQGKRVTAEGRASYGLESGQVSADLNLRAGAKALAILAGTGSYQGPLSAIVRARGTTEALQLAVGADLPAGEIDTNSFAAGRLDVDLRGLPASPGGTVRLSSTDQSYRGEAAFSTAGKQLTVSTLTLFAEGLSVEGSAQANIETLAATADLTVDAGRSTTLISGQTIGGALDANVQIGPDLDPVFITAEGRGLRFEDNEVGSLNLRADGPKSAIAFDLAAVDVTAATLFLSELDTSGELDLQSNAARIDTFLARLPGEEVAAAELVEPTRVSWGETISVAPTTINYRGAGQISLSADIAQQRWRASIDATEVPIPGANALATLDLDLDTSDPQPATYTLNARALTEEDVSYALTADGRWDGRRLLTDARILRNDSEELGSIDAAVPMLLVRQPAIGFEFPTDGLDVRLQYADRLAPIFAFLPIDTPPVTGEIEADMRITGAPNAPKTDGRINLNNGRFEEQEVGITLTNLNGEVAFNVASDGTRATVDITGAGASGREQSVKLAGLVSTRGTDSEVDLKLTLDRAQLADNPELELRATTDLSLTGSLTDMLLKGDLTLDELDLQMPEIEGGENVPTFEPVNIVRVDGEMEDRAGEVETEEAPPVTIRLDLGVRANNGIFVRGRGVESEWSADLDIDGTADAPIIGGGIALEEGTLELAGRRFDLTQGEIDFQRQEEIDPLLNIEAQTEAGQGADEVTAIVAVSGRASDPQIAFRSNPALPEEDVLAIILFGRPASQLGAGEALQLAQAVATLSGTLGGGAGIGGSLRSGLGLDQLSFDPSGRALTVGKYVSEDIYISARQSLLEAGTIISVVYELSRFVNLETTLEPDGASSVGANYKRDY
ncbi:hypothetical protein HK107_01250 [Parvularcula sp. ZS-1/3]|uniref:Translocation and assembly module TamB C-terminal domain-containing protein n=1 Tax=Parvularcula mediterranea TaxID=2732508 RepID=A0A7Y3W3Z2_9PROT|nr:translocation/assembly module TamB domain-containing protein [Parvularcula mediterranea]NNU14948.1 hypothetical protein [Parvularcula mediterranea]